MQQTRQCFRVFFASVSRLRKPGEDDDGETGGDEEPFRLRGKEGNQTIYVLTYGACGGGFLLPTIDAQPPPELQLQAQQTVGGAQTAGLLLDLEIPGANQLITRLLGSAGCWEEQISKTNIDNDVFGQCC